MRNRAQLDEMDIARDWLIRQDGRRPQIGHRAAGKPGCDCGAAGESNQSH